MSDTQVPHSPEAEEATLGSVLINPDLFLDLRDLPAEAFYIHRNRWVWQAYTDLHEARTPIDLLTVSEFLDHTGKLSEVGGSAYLTSLISQVPNTLNAEHYARIVESNHTRRKLVSAANKIATAAYNESLTPAEAQEIASREITSAATNNDKDEAGAFSAALSAVYDRALDNSARILNGQPVEVGIKTGMSELDQFILGFGKEELVIEAAGTGQGKTSHMLDIARYNVLIARKNVAIFSLEMSNEEIARRFISQQAEVDSNKLKTGALDEDEWYRVNKAIELYENGGQVILCDISDLTPAQLRARCLKIQRQHGLDLVIVDYLQLMSGGIKTENRTKEVGYIARQLKLLVKELKCPIIAASQLSRAPEQRSNKRPVLSDLRESGEIEQHANCVIFLHHDELSKNGETECIIAKRRDGRTGSVMLKYIPQFTKFASANSYTFAPNAEYANHAAVGSED